MERVTQKHEGKRAVIRDTGYRGRLPYPGRLADETGTVIRRGSWFFEFHRDGYPVAMYDARAWKIAEVLS